MTTSKLDDYKVDHLFLLIGENPLPNYVAARLLLERGGTPYLIYTTDTGKAAKRLQNILNNEPIGLKKSQLVSLNDYESDAFHIQQEIRDRLKSITQGRIGLNYTGGTKAMAVHAYRAIKEYPDTVFSYLDPRRLEMCIDREDAERARIKVTPAMLQVRVAKLFCIHGLELKSNPIHEAKLPDLNNTLVHFFKDKERIKTWYTWYYQEFCEQARKKKYGKFDNWKNESDLKDSTKVSISLEPAPQMLKESFERLKMVQGDRLILQDATIQTNLEKAKHFCEYLDGKWLEHYLLQQIESIADRNDIQDYGLNFDVPLTGTEQGFEFDVAFTRGYQLFAISVSTTSQRALCKSKLFEAYLRARQMGGDEARVALVCCTDEPDSLKAELAILDNKKIAVFGRDDLTDLSNKIEQWIKQVDKDAR